MVVVLRLACLVCGAALCVTALAPGASGDVETDLRNSQAELRLGNHKAAHRLASAAAGAAREIRHRAQAAHLLAIICQRSGRFAEALRYGEQYLRLVERPTASGIAQIDADRQETALLLGEANGALGRYGPADRWFEHALAIPDGARLAKPVWEAATRLRWANVASAGGATDRAEALYRQAAEGASRVLQEIDRREVDAKHRVAATDVVVEASLATGRADAAAAALAKLLAVQNDAPDRLATTLRLADALNQSTTPERAVDLLERALAELPADEHETTADEARLWEHLAAAHDGQARRDPDRAAALHPQARDELQKAATIFGKLCQDQRDGDTSFAAIEDLQRWYEISVQLNLWDQATEAAKQLLTLREDTLLPNDPAIFRSHRSLGVCYAARDQFADATKEFQKALTFWEQYQPPQTRELCDTRQNLADTARRQNKYDVAEEHLREVLRILGTMPSSDVSIIECHVNLGNVLSANAKYGPAIDEYQAAETACTKVADPQAAERVRMLHSLALLGRAAIYKTQLRFDEAISACRQGVELFRGPSASDQVQQVPVFVALASLHLSRYAWSAGTGDKRDDLTSARNFIDRAAELSAGGADLPTDEHCQLLHVSALTSYRDAQAHFLPGADQDQQAAARSCQQAVDRWTEARDLAEHHQRRDIQARSATFLAEAQLLASQLAGDGALDEAYDNASKAAELLETLQAYPGIHYRALLAGAKILRRQTDRMQDAKAKSDKLAKLEDDLTAAIGLIDAARADSLGTERERARFFSQFVEAYEMLVTCLVEQGRFDEAVGYSQISRNRTFVEQVSVSRQDLRAELKQAGKEQLLDDLRKQTVERDRLRAEVDKQAQASLSPEALQQLREKWAEPLEKAQAECDRLASEIRQSSRAIKNLLEGGLNIEDWKAARKQVVGSDGLLLVYHLGSKASQLFVVTPDDVTCHQLQVRDEAAAELGIEPGPLHKVLARELVTRYLKGPVVGRVRGAPPKPDSVIGPLSPRQGVQLASILLPEEVRSLICSRQPNVVIVAPDEALHMLPLEALLLSDEPKRYVLDDFPPIAYAPSVMVLAALQKRAAAGVQLPWPPTVLTVGNPAYDSDNLLPLLSSAEECHKWADWFAPNGTGQVQLLLDRDATERNVLDKIAGQRLVHFAVHGVVDPQHDSVFAAWLALTPGDGTPDDDGRLYLDEVYELPLAGCELAVLSACDSDIGPERKLEAGSTLTRAFLSAGAARVVSSLWQVDDASTAAMMDEFASSIAQSLALERGSRPNYAEALQRARRRVRQDKEHEEWRHPHYWAPFVLIGPPT